MLALVTSKDMRQQQGWFRLNHEFLRHNAELLAANDESANAPAQNAELSLWSCTKQTWAADLDKVAKSVAAVAPDAPYTVSLKPPWPVCALRSGSRCCRSLDA